ncbi:uncharacterized protein STEHIDRAFT_76593 [Stereum hirsutum FP-91666 SS1]|uniref:uncharacterized protein n=1 Tax=Stereum hirsutum (strain FP-91666) TaxID=721885 RepID=UPI000440DC07|nr:uncharacterized protein STEHIDRAFT_76593 [Stereum hirsutum FP-91666 SS1]EIM87941.1 hypothetical protein STEHIDRAFT_76593 [Stereum hirsutum FP-91666 SS1]
MFNTLTLFALSAFALAGVHAESHTIHFDNRCGSGTPVLEQNFVTLNPGGGDYTSNGPLEAAIAYLQTGSCGYEGTGCTLLETTLKNGYVSSTDVSLISPHAYSVATGFGYYNGCDGTGNDCTSSDCSGAFHVTGDYSAQVQCTADDVDLTITFCD